MGWKHFWIGDKHLLAYAMTLSYLPSFWEKMAPTPRMKTLLKLGLLKQEWTPMCFLVVQNVFDNLDSTRKKHHIWSIQTMV
jgi:hypothetical protein